MCGIAGIFRSHGTGDDSAAVAAMLEVLRRRGPDGEGLEEDGPVTLGHRRLAILDLSDAARQPMRSASGRYLLSFNGEIYNYRDLQDELGLSPSDLRSTSDTEVLLHAWERWGPDALDHLVGQWAFAIYDRRERRLWLTRDRFGEKPLFYHRTPAALSFASSLTALMRVPWVPRTLDGSAMAEYLTMRYVVSPRTVIEGVQKLPGGHLLSVDARGVETRRWYRPQYRPPPAPPSAKERERITEEFGDLFARATRRCMVSDVPVGLLLSDGIDSNSIRYALANQGRPLPSFTYTMSDDNAGLVPCESNGIGAQAWEVRLSVRQRIENLAPAFSSFNEPLGDGASLATWALIRGARSKATVFLCGHGSDEVLGGYRISQDRFRLAWIHYLAWLPAWSLRLLIESKVFGSETPAERQRAVRRARPRDVPAAARYLIHKPLSYADLASVFAPIDVPEPYMGVVDALYAECADEATDLDRIQEVMIRTFLSENILSFADSVAMDSSAELRMPFLDRDLVDFVFRLHPSMRVSRWPGRANTKQILRLWARRHMPAEIVTRRKQGFNFGSVRDLLSADAQAVRDRVLSSAVRRVLPGLDAWLHRPPEEFRGEWGSRLWAVIALGVWCEAAGVQ